MDTERDARRQMASDSEGDGSFDFRSIFVRNM
jgi:hypothetical protein